MRPNRNNGIARKGVRRTAIARMIAFSAMIALLCAGPIETKTISCCFVISPVRWLARHQNHDGSWGDPESPPAERVRLTGMSLLNFASAGYTHLSRDVFDGTCYGTVVKEGLLYLIKAQGESGCLAPGDEGGEADLWGTLALAWMYELTGSPRLGEPAAKAAVHLAALQETWWGTICSEPRLAALGAFVLAIVEKGRLVDPESLLLNENGAIQTLVEMDARGELDPTTAAIARIAARVRGLDCALLSQDACAARLHTAVTADGTRDPHLLFWGSTALYLHGGPQGPLWYGRSEDLIKRPLLDTLRNEPDDFHLYGSWCQAREDLDRQDTTHPGIPEAKANAIRNLIGRWESDRWTDREGASLELTRLGPDAMPFLEQATNQPNPEAQARARQAIQMICRPREDPAHIETTCLNSLSLMLYYRYENSLGVQLCK